MILFSLKTQLFYDSDFNYSDLPDDLREVTSEQHSKLLDAINSGRIVFNDLTFSDPKPDSFHVWSGSGWIDPRTEAEKTQQKRNSLKNLTRYQFKRALVESGFKIDEVKAGIMENPDEMAREIALIALDDVEKFKRLDSVVLTIQKALNKDDAAMDDFWSYALTF